MEYVTLEQMALVDKLAVGKYNLQIKQMMENAGRNVARWIKNELNPKKVIILFGKGNNGGDGLCCARHLKIYGIEVEIVKAFLGKGNKEVENQLEILKEMEVYPVKDFKAKKDDVVIDSLLGYNINGNPRDKFSDLIKAINFMGKQGIKVISYDIPSGENPNGGKFEPFVNADYIMTLALPKTGLKGRNNLYLVNIGIPNELYAKELEINVENYFKDEDVVKINAI